MTMANKGDAPKNILGSPKNGGCGQSPTFPKYCNVLYFEGGIFFEEKKNGEGKGGKYLEKEYEVFGEEEKWRRKRRKI